MRLILDWMDLQTMLHVTAVRCVGPTSLHVAFDDGSERRVDLEAELWGEVFEPLRDPAFFRQGAVDPETGTVRWPNGADFAPEFLHGVGTDVP